MSPNNGPPGSVDPTVPDEVTYVISVQEDTEIIENAGEDDAVVLMMPVTIEDSTSGISFLGTIHIAAKLATYYLEDGDSSGIVLAIKAIKITDTSNTSGTEDIISAASLEALVNSQLATYKEARVTQTIATPCPHVQPEKFLPPVDSVKTVVTNYIQDCASCIIPLDLDVDFGHISFVADFNHWMITMSTNPEGYSRSVTDYCQPGEIRPEVIAEFDEWFATNRSDIMTVPETKTADDFVSPDEEEGFEGDPLQDN